MGNSQLDIRKYDWFEIFRDGLDEDDQKELDALAIRVNKHMASIAVAGHPFPSHMIMLSFMLEEHKELIGLRREIAELGE